MTHAIVVRLGQKGDGIVETASGTVQVPKVLVGEVLDLGDGRRHSIVQPSPDRVMPFCPHYDNCGGCKFQHWREAPYRSWKQGLVATALAVQGIEARVAELVDAHGAGRRRVSLHVRLIEGVWQAGFMEQKSHNLCAIEHCPVVDPALVNAPAIAASFGPVLGPCDVALTSAANGIDVSVRAERKAVEKRFAALTEIFHLHGLLRLSVNGDTYGMKGQPVVKVGLAEVPLPLQSFLQATSAGEEALAKLVMASSPKKAKHVADLFSGLGTFAFHLAEELKVTAIDSDKPAIEALQKGMRAAQGLKPIKAEVRNLFNAPLTVMELKDFDWVVMDPPRAGAEAQSRLLAKSPVKHVTSVSCDVQTFARDARILIDGGLVLKAVTPVDQFKWTAHVEVVGVFAR